MKNSALCAASRICRPSLLFRKIRCHSFWEVTLRSDYFELALQPVQLFFCMGKHHSEGAWIPMLRECYYCYYMPKITLKVARIGNSRGVRIPAQTLERLGIGDSVIMEERSDGILLRPVESGPVKLSWQQTAAAMALSHEDWSDWDSTLADGLDQIPWDEPAKKRRVAEARGDYTAKKASPKGRRAK
jgi:antitoxin component of MazEF toxin-antitoxin module